MIQVMQLDFKNKVSGSTVENPNYALLNGKELTQIGRASCRERV